MTHYLPDRPVDNQDPFGPVSAPPMSAKDKCCGKFRKKAKACKGCPVLSMLGRKERKRKLEKIRKRLAKAA